MRGDLGGRTARAEKRHTAILTAIARDLEALASEAAEVPHESENEHLDGDRDDPVDDVGAAVRLHAMSVVVVVVVVVSSDRGLVDDGDEEHDPLKCDDNSRNDEHRHVRSHIESVRDLCERYARTESDHEAVGHQRREAVEEVGLPLANRDPKFFKSQARVGVHSLASLHFHGVDSLRLGRLGRWRGQVAHTCQDSLCLAWVVVAAGGESRNDRVFRGGARERVSTRRKNVPLDAKVS